MSPRLLPERRGALLIGQVMPIELLRRLRANWVFCVFAGGIVFGCGQYLKGGLVHGTSAFLGGAVFASGYVAVWPAGFWSGVIAAYTAHAVQNAMLLFVIVRLFPGWA